MKASVLLVTAVVGSTLAVSTLHAQEFARARFMLLDNSYLLDDCLICGRPTIQYWLRGTFEMILRESNPLFSTYTVTNVHFAASGPADDPYVITGHGVYTIGGEVALVQSMTLNLAFSDKALTFTNEAPSTDKLFPLVEIELNQSEPNLLQFFSMNLVAAPAREIWFSTGTGFTSGNQELRGTGGDLLSNEGRVVKTVSNLVAKLELTAAATPPNVDAIELAPGGEVLFSLTENQPGSAVGPLQHGDLVSDRGRLVRRNQQLTSAFGIMPVVPDLGLDAVHAKPDGEVLFSTTIDMFSERLGRLLRHGDVLSSLGMIVASNRELLSRFHPLSEKDYGLDALYLWPSGEIWFSLEEGFQDQMLGVVAPGDLLSNQGLVVFRNLELMSAFAPIEDLSDFGLDGLYVVSDVAASTDAPRFTRIRRMGTTTRLEWEGATGRVFQLLRAQNVNGPYAPVSPLIPDVTFEVEDMAPAPSTGFFRLRQW